MTEKAFPHIGQDRLPFGTSGVGKLLREIDQTGDLRIPQTNFGLVNFYRARKEASVLYHTLYKPYRVALEAYFLKGIAASATHLWQEMRAEGIPPNLIVGHLDSPADFVANLASLGTDIWGRSLDSIYAPLAASIVADGYHAVKTTGNTTDHRLFAKLWMVTAVASEFLVGNSVEPIYYLNDGIGTAVREGPMLQYLNAAVYLRERFDPNQSDAYHLRQMSNPDKVYPFAAWSAAHHRTHGIGVIHGLHGNHPSHTAPTDPKFRDYSYSPDDFTYVQHKDQEVLMPKTPLSHVTNEKGIPVLSLLADSVVTGCPALPIRTDAQSLVDNQESVLQVDLIRYILLWSAQVGRATVFPVMLREKRTQS